MKFVADFDRTGLALSISSILILLYFALSVPSFARDYWVGYGFWFIGFFGSQYVTKRSISFNLNKLFMIAVMTGLILLFFAGINYAYSMVQSTEVIIGEKLFSFAVGVSEELFFGIFLLGFLINWLGLNPVFAILLSSGVHSWYHVPNWGSNPAILMLHFISFVGARTVYVFVYPKVSVLLGAHGLWNVGAS